MHSFHKGSKHFHASYIQHQRHSRRVFRCTMCLVHFWAWNWKAKSNNSRNERGRETKMKNANDNGKKTQTNWKQRVRQMWVNWSNYSFYGGVHVFVCGMSVSHLAKSVTLPVSCRLNEIPKNSIKYTIHHKFSAFHSFWWS